MVHDWVEMMFAAVQGRAKRIGVWITWTIWKTSSWYMCQNKVKGPLTATEKAEAEQWKAEGKAFVQDDYAV